MTFDPIRYQELRSRLGELDRQIERVMFRDGGTASDLRTERLQVRLELEQIEAAGQPVHEFCNVCGWRKGGIDSWDGNRCKCGHSGIPVYYRPKPEAVKAAVQS